MLGAELLMSAGIVNSIEAGCSMLSDVLNAGSAIEHFDKMVYALGGPTNFTHDHERHIMRAPIIKPVFADEEGQTAKIKTRDLGIAVIELGGGRRTASDIIDHRVGLSNLLGIRYHATREIPLCLIHAANENDFEKAAAIVKQAYTIGDNAKSWPIVLERITA
jgi:thymidine phosphorylase